jgi:hypothetical protein
MLIVEVFLIFIVVASLPSKKNSGSFRTQLARSAIARERFVDPLTLFLNF